MENAPPARGSFRAAYTYTPSNSIDQITIIVTVGLRRFFFHSQIRNLSLSVVTVLPWIGCSFLPELVGREFWNKGAAGLLVFEIQPTSRVANPLWHLK
jgi:hypothetical protein